MLILFIFPKIKFKDFQGTHWQPSLIPLKTWNKVGGFSEEFSPGLGSDPDFSMKLWNEGVRLFKGLGPSYADHPGAYWPISFLIKLLIFSRSSEVFKVISVLFIFEI